MLRFLNAGESHGPALSTIIEGMPAGLPLTKEYINFHLQQRQSGYGRGKRMEIEKDQVKILSGVRGGFTLGSPISLCIENKDFKNWEKIMSPGPEADTESRVITRPRPGHADLTGAIKYHHKDIRNVLERASARETATRVAAASVARRLLEEVGICIISFVKQIGHVEAECGDDSFSELQKKISSSQLLCPDGKAEEKMIAAIDKCKEEGDSLGGIFQIQAYNVPVGLGSDVHYHRKLDGRLAGALMSIQAIKGVEFGLGFKGATLTGSQVHDEIFHQPEVGFYRETNHAGGIEGGMSNGQTLIIRAAMKPIPTLYKPLKSVDMENKEPFAASIERSDVCAVPAAAIVGEAMVAWELAVALLKKFPGDSINELKQAVENYRNYVRQV